MRDGVLGEHSRGVESGDGRNIFVGERDADGILCSSECGEAFPQKITSKTIAQSCAFVHGGEYDESDADAGEDEDDNDETEADVDAMVCVGN